MLYRFEQYTLDTDRRELRRGVTPIRLAPQAFDLLEYLVRNRNRVLGKDDLITSIWNGRIISESALSTRINAVRTAIGDSGAQQRLLKTIPRKGFCFVAAAQEETAAEPIPSTNAEAKRMHSSTSQLVQDIRFCLSRDGTRIAYATCGAGLPVVWAAHFIGHLQLEWDSPIWRPWIELFSRHNTLIRYDGRGCGLSDREHVQFSLAKAIEDLDAVIAAAQMEEFILLGFSSAGAIALNYAALHPERIRHLILVNAYTRGWLARSTTMEQCEDAKIQVKAIEFGWGQDNPAFRQLYTSRWLPDSTALQYQSFTELIRQFTTPANAAKLVEMAFEHDSCAAAVQVRSPTTVVHASGDCVAPFEEGRALASLIPGARFVPLESKNHLTVDTEPAFSLLTQEIDTIIAATRAEL